MKTKFTFLAAFLVIFLAGCMTSQRGFPPVAQINNYDMVDAHVTRGAQPNAAGLLALAKAGVTVVINLRQPGDAWVNEADFCKAFNIGYTNFPMSGVSAPTDAEMRAIIKFIKSCTGPVFIHCQYGCDRTGTVVACYLIQEGIDPQVALKDAEFHGMSPLLVCLKHFIAHFKKV
jgi:tyrosine-protein phosphatase SIW14